MTKTKPSYAVFWLVVDADGVHDPFPDLASLFAKAVNYTSDAVVLEIDPNEERIRNLSEDAAHIWLERADIDDPLPDMFEPYVADWWDAIQEKRDDPKGLSSQADHWHDLLNS